MVVRVSSDWFHRYLVVLRNDVGDDVPLLLPPERLLPPEAPF
jgi:hypothetical protein